MLQWNATTCGNEDTFLVVLPVFQTREFFLIFVKLIEHENTRLLDLETIVDRGYACKPGLREIPSVISFHYYLHTDSIT